MICNSSVLSWPIHSSLDWTFGQTMLKPFAQMNQWTDLNEMILIQMNQIQMTRVTYETYLKCNLSWEIMAFSMNFFPVTSRQFHKMSSCLIRWIVQKWFQDIRGFHHEAVNTQARLAFIKSDSIINILHRCSLACGVSDHDHLVQSLLSDLSIV